MNELTDDQIDALLVAHGKGDDGFHQFARTVIAAHEALRQAGQEPYGWQVAGTRELYTGRYAEIDARASAASIGGVCRAFPLYTAPQSTTPSGYVLVPLEPTPEMLTDTYGLGEKEAVRMYGDMLAAAPRHVAQVK